MTMKHFFTLLLLLLISVWVGMELQAVPGYAKFLYGNNSVTVPLWFLGLIWVVTYLMLYIVLAIVNSLLGANTSFRLWSKRRTLRDAHKRTGKGLIALAEGNWQSAEKLLFKSAEIVDTPLINYLAAALAAQKQAHYKSRDNYLRLAHDANPEAEVAIGLTQAQLQLDRKQYEQALATLCRLRQLAPNHEYVLRLLQSLYVKLHDWDSVLKLLPALEKRKVLPREEFATFESRIHRELLIQAADAKDVQAILQAWQRIPKKLMRDPELVAIYADCLLQNGAHESAYTVLRDTLKKVWDPCLLHHYGDARAQDSEKQLSIAEGWLKTHRNESELYYCLGRLCTRLKLWGKAKNYFEKSLQLKPQLKVYRDLGQLLETMQEKEKAFLCYRDALTSS